MFRGCFFSSLFCLVAILLTVPVDLSAQTDWDHTIDKYEQLCDKCLETKRKIAAGETVPQNTVTSLLQELGSLRSTLQQNTGTMTQQQRSRFDSIRRRYAPDSYSENHPDNRQTSLKPIPKQATEKNAPPPRSIAPETCSVSTIPALKRPEMVISDTIHYDRTPHLDAPAVTAVCRPPKEESQKSDFHFSVLPQITVTSKMAFGGFLSASSNKWGGYLSLLSSFTGKQTALECLSSGEMKGGGYFWGDGTSETAACYYTAGVLFRINKFISINLGGGYGEENVYWHDIEGNWVKVTDLSYSGLAAQAAAVATVSHISIGASAIYLPSSGSIVPTVAVGYTF